MVAVLRCSLRRRPVLGSHEAVHDYLRAVMAFERREQVRVLYLDKGDGLIADELHTQGTVHLTAVHPREIVRRALEVNAAAIRPPSYIPTSIFLDGGAMNFIEKSAIAIKGCCVRAYRSCPDFVQ
jgi:DNA repair protein RadC